jgi:hypothetical protein
VGDRGSGTWPVRAARVVGVLPVRHGGAAVAVHDLVGNPREQFVLAIKAAVRLVAAVLRTLTFPGLHLQESDADKIRDAVGGGPLLPGQARRNAENGEHLIPTQGTRGQRQQSRGVHPAGERHP